MEIPVRIALQDVPGSGPLKSLIRRKARALARLHDRIVSMRVAVRASHKYHTGARWHVTIEVVIPGGDVVVGRDPGDQSMHDDVQIAIRDAFRAAKRLLSERTQRIRRDVKSVVGPPHAIVGKLFHYEGYGFLTTPEGEQIYFHRNAVLHGAFEQLKTGDEVRYASEMGESGLQATTVAPTSHHLVSRDVVA